MHSGKKWRSAVWLNAMHSGKKANSRIRTPFYIFFLNPVYVSQTASSIFEPGVFKYYEPVFIPNTPKNRAVSCLYHKAKKFRTLRNLRIFCRRLYSKKICGAVDHVVLCFRLNNRKTPGQTDTESGRL